MVRAGTREEPNCSATFLERLVQLLRRFDDVEANGDWIARQKRAFLAL